MTGLRWPGRHRRRGASLRERSDPHRRRRMWLSRLRWLGAGAVLLGLCLGLYAAAQKLLDPRLFPLRHVHVEAQLDHLRPDRLRTVVDSVLGQNFFALDLTALRRRMAAQPWVETVTVRRAWPDAVVVTFTERRPFGYWGEDELVDVHGQRFRPRHLPRRDEWPQLVGPDGHERTLLAAYGQAGTLLRAVGLSVRRLELDARRAWRMTLDNGLELNLGREQFQARLLRFVSVYPHLVSRVAIIRGVDMRYANGFAVRWRNG